MLAFPLWFSILKWGPGSGFNRKVTGLKSHALLVFTHTASFLGFYIIV